jgi:acyl-CoA synthetase (AMP-forming)/AMP-acid ligase II
MDGGFGFVADRVKDMIISGGENTTVVKEVFDSKGHSR